MVISTFLPRLRTKISEALRNRVVRVSLASGISRSSNRAISVVFAARCRSDLIPYYRRKIFSTLHEERTLGRCLVSRLPTLLANEAPDLYVLDLPLNRLQLAEDLRALKIPRLVRQHIDLTGDIADIKGRCRTRYRTLFNRFSLHNPFQMRISQDEADLRHFYQRMYLPHIAQQFDDAAVIDSYEQQAEILARGFLLIANDGHQDVAATLCHIKGDTMHYSRAGVLDGDRQHIQRGAQSALYVQMILHAKQAGLHKLNLGMSYPLYEDGVFKHKRAWGAQVTPDESKHTYVCLGGAPESTELIDFLTSNPVIGLHDGGLIGYAAWEDRPESPVADLIKTRETPGLSGLVLVNASTRAFSHVAFAPESSRSPVTRH